MSNFASSMHPGYVRRRKEARRGDFDENRMNERNTDDGVFPSGGRPVEVQTGLRRNRCNVKKRRKLGKGQGQRGGVVTMQSMNMTRHRIFARQVPGRWIAVIARAKASVMGNFRREVLKRADDTAATPRTHGIVI